MVYIVLLNWNGWQDTVACIESLFMLSGETYKIVVCDNDSSDESIQHLVMWAEGKDRYLPADSPVPLVTSSKPIHYALYGRLDAEKTSQPARDPCLVFIENGENLGFAGGCNVGMRYALRDPNMSSVWLLNNDTVVSPDALVNLVSKQRSEPKLGIVGSVSAYYTNPSTLESLGGATFNPWLSSASKLGCGLPLTSTLEAPLPRFQSPDYIVGASMLVSRQFLETVGLMYEGFFLYYEEIDWARHGSRSGFKIAVAPGSLIFHKVGTSANQSQGAKTYGGDTDFYFLRNRLLVARRNYPFAVPTVCAYLLAVLTASVLKRQWKRVRMFLSEDFWLGTGRRRAI